MSKKIIHRKYNHALDRMIDLYKAGLVKEIVLAETVDLLVDELQRVIVCSDDSEVIGICQRAIESVPEEITNKPDNQ